VRPVVNADLRAAGSRWPRFAPVAASVGFRSCKGALNSRITIEQAKGAIAQAHNVTVDVAFELIRAYTHNNRRLSERNTEAWPTRESAISSAVISRD
jgi:AmiR/NasT family two-component response regulator